MATTYDLNITQGSSFNIRLTAKDDAGNHINLSGYSVSGYIRNRYSDSSFLLNMEPSIVSGGSPDAITSGKVDINLAATGTAALPITQAMYDVEVYKNDQVIKLLNGKANVHPEATY
tara:strand:- start:1529 stop:1879 length:351 start_codon:yes stop_codon:yes gene_type:complete